jgi:hypothetical protein
MAITPDRAAVTGNQSNPDLLQHIADLRGALERAVREISFCAGREAADDPEQSARLMAAAGEMTEVLNRTAP